MKKKVNKSGIITIKNDVISINQLNYKEAEKSHVTEDLVGSKPGGGGAHFGCTATSLLLDAKWLNIFIYINNT